MTFFRYARTKGGGMGSFVLFCPVLNCRNALKIRYLLYYTRNIAQSALCRLCGLQMSVTGKRKAHQQTTRRAQNTAKIRVPLRLCFPLFVCLFVCLSVCLSLFVSLSVCFLAPFCLIIRVNCRLKSYTER